MREKEEEKEDDKEMEGKKIHKTEKERIGNHKKRWSIKYNSQKKEGKKAEMVKVLRHEKKKETDGECNRTEVKRKK